MKQLSLSCKLIIILMLVLFTSRSASHAQFADLTVSRVYLPFVNDPIPPVRINEACMSRQRSPYLMLLGDIICTSDQAAYNVVIEVRLYDPSNQLIGISTGTTVLTATLPGQLNPFYVATPVYLDDFPTGSHWEALIIDWSLNSNKIYRPAKTTITHIEDIQVGTIVDVEVRNDGAEPLMNVTGTAWSLKQASIIDRSSVTTTLAPGEIVTYTEFLYMVYGVYTQTIRTAAQGYIAP